MVSPSLSAPRIRRVLAEPQTERQTVRLAVAIGSAVSLLAVVGANSTADVLALVLAWLTTAYLASRLLAAPCVDLFGPTAIMFWLVCYGVLGKVALLTGLGDNIIVRSAFHLEVVGSSQWVGGILILTIGVVAFTAGLGPETGRRPDAASAPLSIPRVPLITVSGGFLFLGCAGLFMLVRALGIETLDWANVSSKRLISIDSTRFGDSGEPAATYVFWRIALLAKFGFYASLIYRTRVTSRDRLVNFLFRSSLAMSLFVPFFMNNRAGVALIFVDYLVIQYYLDKRPPKRVALAGAGAVFSLAVIALWFRSGPASGRPMSDALVTQLVGNDLFDASKVASIYAALGDDFPYLNGVTLVNWIPLVDIGDVSWSNVGPFTWREVYGGDGLNGVPPTLIGETLLNFGLVITPIVLFCFGIVVRLAHGLLLSRLKAEHYALLYGVCFARLIAFMHSSSLGVGVAKSMLDLVPMMLVVLVLGNRSSDGPDLPASDTLDR